MRARTKCQEFFCTTARFLKFLLSENQIIGSDNRAAIELQPYSNMCTFFEEIVRFGYVVQNMLRILCANFEPFLTKTGLLRAIWSFREQSLSRRSDRTEDNDWSLKLWIALSKPIFVGNGSKSAHNIQSIFCTTYPNLTIFSKKVHMLVCMTCDWGIFWYH